MRIIIRKHLISVFGSMEPGAIHDIPDAKAHSWCRAGIAEAVDEHDRVIKVRPEVIPEGMFWCEKHRILHSEDSGPGEKCLERIAEEEAEAKVKADEEAEQARLEDETKAEAARQAEKEGGEGES